MNKTWFTSDERLRSCHPSTILISSVFMKVSDFFSPLYQLPFLIPWGLPRFLGNCPSGQEPSIFPHDAKIAGCYLLFGYLECNQTHVAQCTLVIKQLWLLPSSIFPVSWQLLSNPPYWQPVCETPMVSGKWQFSGWPNNGEYVVNVIP